VKDPRSAGNVDLETAQHEIATDWIKAYQEYIAKSPPASGTREVQFAPETATNGEVWVIALSPDKGPLLREHAVGIAFCRLGGLSGVFGPR